MIKNSLNELNEKFYCHYTTLEKFKLILEFGTLRFSESTGSNDFYDTKLIYDLIKGFKYIFPSDVDEVKFKDYLLSFYNYIQHKNVFNFYVCCFTDKEDSRMFWDTYAREIRVQENEDRSKYKVDIKTNGICICFKKNKILEMIKTIEQNESNFFKDVIYSRTQISLIIDDLLKDAYNKYSKLSSSEDQSQDYVKHTKTHGLELIYKKCFTEAALEFYRTIDYLAPLYKHEFWEEENEYRAVLVQDNKEKENHIDIPITEDQIDHIVLGPDFSKNDEKILKSIEKYKLDYNKLEIKHSKGTDVIRSRSIEIKK